jgi:hypothetical protein
VRESGLPTNPYFLFLSAKQARAFLRDGQPEFMIFVPEKLDPDARPRIDLEKILLPLWLTWKDLAWLPLGERRQVTRYGYSS